MRKLLVDVMFDVVCVGVTNWITPGFEDVPRATDEAADPGPCAKPCAVLSVNA